MHAPYGAGFALAHVVAGVDRGSGLGVQKVLVGESKTQWPDVTSVSAAIMKPLHHWLPA